MPYNFEPFASAEAVSSDFPFNSGPNITSAIAPINMITAVITKAIVTAVNVSPAASIIPRIIGPIIPPICRFLLPYLLLCSLSL